MTILDIVVGCPSSFRAFTSHPKAYILIHQDHKVPGSEAQLLVPLDHKVSGSHARLPVPSHDAALHVPRKPVYCITHDLA